MGKNRRRLEDLNLIDSFLFSEVMADKEAGQRLARLIIETVLGIKTGKLEIRIEQGINGVDNDMHGIRLDAYVTETTDCGGREETVRIVDIEPNVYREENLPKRNRYYHSLTDVRYLEAGSGYEELPEVITIWILNEDPFGENRMVYTVKNIVEENPELVYNDGIKTVILYTDGAADIDRKVSRKLKKLLQYFKNSSINNAQEAGVEDIHGTVERIKDNPKRGVEYMRLQDMIYYERRDAREEGREEGRQEGRISGRLQEIISMTRKKIEKGKPAEVIADELESDIDIIVPIYEIISKYPKKTDEEICSIYQEQIQLNGNGGATKR